jgi:hypothetical protein
VVTAATLPRLAGQAFAADIAAGLLLAAGFVAGLAAAERWTR